jgi:hypothetical protein
VALLAGGRGALRCANCRRPYPVPSGRPYRRPALGRAQNHYCYPPRVPHRRRQADMGASARGGSEPRPSPGPGGREGQVGRSGRSRLPGHGTRPEDPMIRRGHREGTIYPRADGRWEAALWADGRRRAAGPAAPRAGSHAVWATRPGLGRTPERSSQQLPTGRPTPRGDSLPVTFATSGAGDGRPALSWGWRSPRRPPERAGPGNPAGPNLPADRRTARRVHPKDLLLHTGGIPPPRTVRGENDPRRPGVGTRVGDCMPAQAPPSSIPTPAPPHWLPARVRSPPAARRGSDQLVVDARTRRARATIRVPTSHADAAPTSGAFYSFVVGLVVPRLFQR